MDDLVLVTADDGVATVTLNLSGQHNAQSVTSLRTSGEGALGAAEDATSPGGGRGR